MVRILLSNFAPDGSELSDMGPDTHDSHNVGCVGHKCAK